MTSAEEYLRQVRRSMAGMAPAVRDDILRELRGHIAEASAANGGNVTASLAAMGSAKEIGRRYRDVYGFGVAYRLLFAVAAFIVAVPSVPVLSAGPNTVFPFSLSIVFVIVAAAWLIWVSAAAGSRAGLFAGTAAMIGRFAAFGISAALQPGADVTPGGLGILFAVGVAFVLLGWLPGTARKSWQGSRLDL